MDKFLHLQQYISKIQFSRRKLKNHHRAIQVPLQHPISALSICHSEETNPFPEFSTFNGADVFDPPILIQMGHADEGGSPQMYCINGPIPKYQVHAKRHSNY